MSPGPVTDPRAHALRARYHELFEAPELPVPVEAIAEDLLGLRVEEANTGECSGLLYPAERLILLNETEPRERKRFTLAHEVGHWVCQVAEGKGAPVMCRAADVEPSADRRLEREANVFAAELLMPERAVRQIYGTHAEGASQVLDVSRLALRWRLYSLGLLAEPPVSGEREERA